MISNEIKQCLSSKYYCKNCDYMTDRKSNINNHYLSTKHIKSIDSNIIKQKKSIEHTCENCDKKYKDYSGLWRHKKKCFEKEETIIGNKLILKIIMENQELKDLLKEKNKIILELTNFNQVG